ncbi:MAG: ParB/RepB/Spo0J family partition protein [Clostridia bacterium]|nr:ParB/RepB/Spo0J family partition protein [Clostridia bacterium]MBR2734757.1 ParB/RepB/Spo0J family partition protein [Clostridia bacterium]
MSGLGKGLDLIFMENNTESENTPVTLNLDELEANTNQPRTEFNDEALKELADSIAKHGIIQPIVVKPLSSGKYKIIAGERRYRASKMAGLKEVPVIIKDISDAEIMELALVENLQRENLNALEEARGYKSLMDNYGFTQAQVAEAVGKSRPYVANTVRLINLPDAVIEKLENGEITAGHARAMLALSGDDDIKRALETTVSQGLNVRQLEQLIKKMTFKEIEKPKSFKTIKSDVLYKKIESDLQKKLKHKVKIISGKRKKGTVQIEFLGEEDLSNIYKMLLG